MRAGSSFDGPEFAPYPPWLRSDEDRGRWDITYAIVEHLSRLYEPTGQADPRFCWVGVRALYRSDVPTGDPSSVT